MSCRRIGRVYRLQGFLIKKSYQTTQPLGRNISRTRSTIDRLTLSSRIEFITVNSSTMSMLPGPRLNSDPSATRKSMVGQSAFALAIRSGSWSIPCSRSASAPQFRSRLRFSPSPHPISSTSSLSRGQRPCRASKHCSTRSRSSRISWWPRCVSRHRACRPIGGVAAPCLSLVALMLVCHVAPLAGGRVDAQTRGRSRAKSGDI